MHDYNKAHTYCPSHTSLGLLILLVGKILHTCFETLKNVDIMVVHCFSLDASATN